MWELKHLLRILNVFMLCQDRLSKHQAFKYDCFLADDVFCVKTENDIDGSVSFGRRKLRFSNDRAAVGFP